MLSTSQILSILGSCCDSNAFPMLDNGYVYLAATRLSAFRCSAEWAIVIEVFGFSPRSGLPDVNVQTFASQLFNRDPREKYASAEAYERYLLNNPHNESRFFFPIDEGPWQDAEDLELVAEDASEIPLRGGFVPMPSRVELRQHGIIPEQPPRLQVFELCRYLAATRRDEVLAQQAERRASMPPEMTQILVLDEWHHPNLVDDERPSQSTAFQQLAEVLATGDITRYRPMQAPNTHWKFWPDGGRL